MDGKGRKLKRRKCGNCYGAGEEGEVRALGRMYRGGWEWRFGLSLCGVALAQAILPLHVRHSLARHARGSAATRATRCGRRTRRRAGPSSASTSPRLVQPSFLFFVPSMVVPLPSAVMRPPVLSPVPRPDSARRRRPPCCRWRTRRRAATSTGASSSHRWVVGTLHSLARSLLGLHRTPTSKNSPHPPHGPGERQRALRPRGAAAALGHAQRGGPHHLHLPPVQHLPPHSPPLPRGRVPGNYKSAALLPGCGGKGERVRPYFGLTPSCLLSPSYLFCVHTGLQVAAERAGAQRGGRLRHVPVLPQGPSLPPSVRSCLGACTPWMHRERERLASQPCSHPTPPDLSSQSIHPSIHPSTPTPTPMAAAAGGAHRVQAPEQAAHRLEPVRRHRARTAHQPGLQPWPPRCVRAWMYTNVHARSLWEEGFYSKGRKGAFLSLPTPPACLRVVNNPPHHRRVVLLRHLARARGVPGAAQGPPPLPHQRLRHRRRRLLGALSSALLISPEPPTLDSRQTCGTNRAPAANKHNPPPFIQHDRYSASWTASSTRSCGQACSRRRARPCRAGANKMTGRGPAIVGVGRDSGKS